MRHTTLGALVATTVALLSVANAPSALAQKATAPLFAGPLDSASLATAVDTRLTRAQKSVESLLAFRSTRTAANTLRPWDDALTLIGEASGLADLAVNVYPDSIVRQEGVRAADRVSKARNAMFSDPRPARAFQALDTARLSPAEKRLVALTLREFRRTGALLPDAKRNQARKNLESLDRLGLAFQRNIAEDTTSLAFEEAELAGLPADWIASRRRDQQKRVIVTLQYPDVFPTLDYASNRAVRQRLWAAFQSAGRQPNVILLDSIIRLREQTAHLLGYPTWADYQAETVMTGSADSIRSFIKRVRETAAPATARLNSRLLQRLRREDPSVDRLAAWDTRHASELLRRSDYNLDNREVRAYFPFKAVHDGILSVMAELFEVEIRPAKLPVWHPSVTAYEMREKGRLLGRFYLDLHPRTAKFQHAAAFLVRPALGGRQMPEAFLATNFPGDSAGREGLLELDDVETFFHEFGHLVHVMFAQQPYGYLQWPAESDFTEAPSNMLEEFVRSPRVLQRLSRHVETGRPIPDSLIARIEAANAFGRPRWAAQQAAYSAISLELHSHPADSINVDSVTHRALNDYTGVFVPEPAHFATSFGHLASSYYASTYYTYLWSQVISKDLWSAFDPARPFDRGPARRYRDLVLRPGGTKPAGELVSDFLGRPFSFASWQRWVQDEEVARGQ